MLRKHFVWYPVLWNLGTQDTLLYNSEKEVENNLIMVMRAPTQVIVEKVRRAKETEKQ